MNQENEKNVESEGDIDNEIEVIDSVAVSDADDWCTPPGGAPVDHTAVSFTGMFSFHVRTVITYSQNHLQRRLNWAFQILITMIWTMTGLTSFPTVKDPLDGATYPLPQ